jgi:hypothetical protein
MQRLWRLLITALAQLVFAAFAMALSSPARAQDDGSGNPVGSWFGTVCPEVTICPEGSPNGFTDLLSIHLGGTVTGSNGNAHDSQNPHAPSFAQVDASDFFGAWEPIGHNQFDGTVKWLLFLGPNSPSEVTAIYCPPPEHVFPRTEYRCGHSSDNSDTPAHQKRRQAYRPVHPPI